MALLNIKFAQVLIIRVLFIYLLFISFLNNALITPWELCVINIYSSSRGFSWDSSVELERGRKL